MPESRSAANVGKMPTHTSRSAAFCHMRYLFAAAARARLAPGAQNPQMHKKAGFFRVSFARAPGYASFESWKSSFAK